MTSIIVNIEAGENGECGLCDLCHGSWCGGFDKTLVYRRGEDFDGDFLRCPACLEAEAKLKALVEAADSVRKSLWGYAQFVPDRLLLKQALAAVKGEK